MSLVLTNEHQKKANVHYWGICSRSHALDIIRIDRRRNTDWSINLSCENFILPTGKIRISKLQDKIKR